jgi:hypothetical protein
MGKLADSAAVPEQEVEADGGIGNPLPEIRAASIVSSCVRQMKAQEGMLIN